jgi:hypothetical protein
VGEQLASGAGGNRHGTVCEQELVRRTNLPGVPLGLDRTRFLHGNPRKSTWTKTSHKTTISLLNHPQASFGYSRPGRDRPGFGRQPTSGKKLSPPEFFGLVTPGGAKTLAQTLSIPAVLGGKKQSPCLPWKRSQQRDG